mmetsp:Transcript_10462/g.23004  ORF Transcript_10462/g.23004 Transcript_10462/m.23004 type:complete len:208 (-) Transcript_10462:23-646(-)
MCESRAPRISPRICSWRCSRSRAKSRSSRISSSSVAFSFLNRSSTSTTLRFTSSSRPFKCDSPSPRRSTRCLTLSSSNLFLPICSGFDKLSSHMLRAALLLSSRGRRPADWEGPYSKFPRRRSEYRASVTISESRIDSPRRRSCLGTAPEISDGPHVSDTSLRSFDCARLGRRSPLRSPSVHNAWRMYASKSSSDASGLRSRRRMAL